MHIKRDYDKPFFSRKTRYRRSNGFKKVFYGVLLVTLLGFGAFTLVMPERLQSAAQSVIGPEMTPTPLPSDIAREGLELYFAGDLDAAATKFARAVEQRPDSVSYLYEYGQILIDLDRVDEALSLASQILDLAPSDPRGYALRARGMVWNGNSSGAIPVAMAGLDIDPEFGPLYAALSRAYVGEARWRESQEVAQQAIEYAPDDVHSYWAYASALSQVGARDEAIREYERAIATNPTFVPPYFELAYIYLATGRDQEAIGLYDQVLGMQPRHSQALLRKCEAYRKVGEFERSVGLCQDAVSADPENASARYRLGVFLYNDFAFQDAKDEFEMCIELDESNVLCTLRLGLTHYYLARDAYQKCRNDGISATNCQSVDICRTGWNQLQDALIMAQSQGGFSAAEENIREGLTAISDDIACAGVSGRAIPTPTPPPEATPETTAPAGEQL